MTTVLEKVKSLALETKDRFFVSKDRQVMEKGTHDYVTQTDLAVSEFLTGRLLEILPGSQVMSEEDSDHNLPENCDVWIIDPIDGTTNFIYSLPMYCVSIGLLRDGEPILGVVYNPVIGQMFSALKGHGAYLNGEAITVRSDDKIENTLILAETNPYNDRTKSRTMDVIKSLFVKCIDYRVTGSAALDICYIACGYGGAFVCESLNPWDMAAGCAILSEAGGKFTNWQGKDVSFANVGTLIASNGKLHSEVLEHTK